MQKIDGKLYEVLTSIDGMATVALFGGGRVGYIATKMAEIGGRR
jgi:hypothetical protein